MKVIHIGVGGFGSRWVSILKNAPETDVVAMVDVDDQALAQACQAGGYDEDICYPTLDAALAQVEAEALVCVTPPKFHREHAVTALEAGLHVLCEKPLADNLPDCLAMFDAARATGRTLAVSQQYRYRPDMAAMARAVQAGRVGRIGQLLLEFYKGWYFVEADFRRWMPQPLLIDMAIHHFDLIRYVTGLEAVSVRGESWNPSWSENTGDTSLSLTFQMNNDARVVYNASWCAQGTYAGWNGNWLLEGDRGALRYRDGKLTWAEAAGRYSTGPARAVRRPRMPRIEQPFVISHFVESVQAGRQPQTGVFDNIRSIAMVFAAVRAVATGEKVTVLTPELAERLEA